MMNIIGLDYFGARYYDSGLSVWLSVDPLSDKYLSTSPYMYVLGNPIKFIDPNGMNHTKYEDIDGNLLGKTNDGSDATVVISNENKATFTAEFNSAKEVGAHDSKYYNKRWIGMGDAMQVNPGGFVPSWALDAADPKVRTEIEKSKNASRENGGFRINPTGPALIILGQKLVSKRGGIGGGGKAGNLTSAASKSLRWTDRTIQGFLKTNAKLAPKGFLARSLGTRGIGAALGRVVPYVGIILTVGDVSYQAGKYYGPSKWYGNDDSSWFR